MHAGFKKFTLKFKHPLATSRGVLETRDVYILAISADGFCGIGECAPLPGLSCDNIELLESKIEQVCQKISAGANPEDINLTDFPALRFGIEMAWWDFKNGGTRKFFKTDFVTGKTKLPIHGLIKMGSLESMLTQVEKKVSQGFRCIKFKIGANDFGEEIDFLSEFRNRYPAPDYIIRLDANGAFFPENVFEKIEAYAQFNVEFLEQPIKSGNLKKLSEICRVSPIPIALDEELIGVKSCDHKQNLLEKVRPQFIILKPTLLGGISESEEWIKVANSVEASYVVNSMLESNLGFNYIAQWTSSLSGEIVHGLGTGQLFVNNFFSPLKLNGNFLAFEPSSQKVKDLAEITLN